MASTEVYLGLYGDNVEPDEVINRIAPQATRIAHKGQRNRPSAAIERNLFRNRLLAILLMVSASPALAIPPPPSKPPLLRKAKMTATVQLIEASNGSVRKITKLCTISGKIPVYSDDRGVASWHAEKISGCSMPWKGESLPVSVWGAKSISKDAVSYATAVVSVVPPDAVPLCPDLCGPQPLADARAEIRVSGSPKSMTFSLNPNPTSLLNAKPAVWLEVDVEIVE